MRTFLYIDPGTGSMLFTILIGIFGAGVYLLRNVFAKLRFVFTGGKRGKHAEDAAQLPFVIFSDSKRYWNVFGPVCEVFERRGQPITYLTASPDDPALERKFEHVQCRFIGEGNRAFSKLNYLHADVLFSTTPGLDVYQWKRSKNVKWYVHAPHASSDITLYRMFGVDYYDAVLLSGEYQIEQLRELERKRGLPAKELVLTGLPFMDTMLRRLETAEPLPPHPTTVLLAPSWGKSSIFGRYGGRAIDALLATGYRVIIRPHPQSFTSEKEMIERLQHDYPESEQLEWNRDNDNFEVLRRSDLLISDFSGVIFDFALVFGKPVIYADTSFDKAPYDACWIDEELWTFRTLPRIGRQLTEEGLKDMKALIDETLSSADTREAIEAARRETWAYVGEGAERIADYLIEKRAALLAEEEEKQQAKAAKDARGKKREAKRTKTA